MENRYLLFLKKILSSDEPKHITITYPPDKLPPALVGILVRNRTADSLAESGESPAHVDSFATLLDLANKGILSIEEYVYQKDYIIRKLEKNEEYSFESVLLDCIPRIGYEKLSSFYVKFNSIISQFRSAIKEEALNLGLYNAEVSSKRLTDFGQHSAENWKEFRRYILRSIDDKDLAVQKVQQWHFYLPYAAEFFLGKAWIKIFSELDAPPPFWFKINTVASNVELNSSNKISLKSMKYSLIKMGNKIAEPYIDW
jgi:hypothetical protein